MFPTGQVRPSTSQSRVGKKNQERLIFQGLRHKYVSQQRLVDCWNQIGPEPGLEDVGGSAGSECCSEISRFLIEAEKYDPGSTISPLEPVGQLEVHSQQAWKYL